MTEKNKEIKTTDDIPNTSHESNNDIKIVENLSQSNTSKIIFRTFLYTLLSIVVFFGFAIASCVVVAPKTVIKGLNYFGLEKASYVVYQRMYERDKTNENLYNVLQLSIKYEDYKKIEKYSKAMIDNFDFPEFAQKIDLATKSSLNINHAAYADSYESYVMRNLTIALYKNNKISEAKLLAIDSIYSNANELSAFVGSIVFDDNLSDVNKKDQLVELSKHLKLDKVDELGRLDVLLDSDNFNPEIESEDEKKIVALRQRIKIRETKYYILTAMGENKKAEQEQKDIKDEQATIIQLLNKNNG